ncbi:threonine/homoserine/homoserine lactone efflux protein [Celerinatantimonas diazotrophica]|uniref:Threonine/homoserine/homoserine lactone efflux protein n=1 Tax=Celerinatantimonas diazotrophica TaxID=412034 RepID=A0A4R1KFB2_9GAMM|nr:threonine/homoserine/homoserine lactone efflux protein [Celerinatantimonas diazotrophica]CAG9294919.1 Leucine efflux protein [Celerinatantimonas diazotrophica]
MDINQWLPLAAVCLLGAMSPGPSLAMVIRHTVSGGRRCGYIAAWCHTTGIAVYAALSVFGLAIILLKAQLLFHLIALAGAGYLIWMGVMSFRQTANKFELNSSRDAVRSSPTDAARDALAISLLNPKILLFFIALFSPFVQSSHSSHGVLVMTPWLIDGCWYSLVVTILSRAGLLSWVRRHNRYLDWICGLILVGIGVEVIFSTLF